MAEIDNLSVALDGPVVPPTVAAPEAMLQVIALALGMDPNTKVELQKPDVNFLQEIAKLPFNFSGIPSGTDVHAMRNWVKDVFTDGPLGKYRANLGLNLRRSPAQEIRKKIITVSRADGNGTYGIWVFEPVSAKVDNQASSRPAILMFHGGGWIHGDPSGDEALSKAFASELDAVVFGIDYRLAPENPLPTPLDDCSDALQWVINNASTYNIDINRIGLWGASAGGHLAANVALRCAREKPTSEKPALALVSLVVPVTAHPKAETRFKGQRSLPLSQSEQLFVDATPPPEAAVQEMEKLFDFLTGGNTNPFDPIVSPLTVESAPYHAPTLITVAASDGLCAQGLAYATLLRSFGVDVSEDILPGVPHMFTMPVNATVARQWHKRQIDSFAKAFGVNFVS